MNQEIEEFLDLVNKEDQVIGRLERSKVYSAGLNNFRVVNAFLVNNNGQLWIPRRTAHKKLFPLYLDVSVGGHVSSGETYDQAFAREMQEEVGLSLQKVVYEKLGALNPYQHGVSAFMYVYTFFFDQVPPYNENDFVEYFWLYPHELMEKLRIDKAKGDVPLLIDFFFRDGAHIKI